MQVTTRVDECEFGNLTRTTEDGTETVFLLKITDIYGSEFRFILGEPKDFNSETETICGHLMDDFLTRINFQDV